MIAFKTFLAMAVEDDVQEKGKGLWHNIHQKRKRGERMRKKGEKGAPTAAAMKSASEGTGKRKGETFEKGFKRRVVKTTNPEHKEKGFNWRIKGKERDEISIKLYKNKPDYKEFVKQMRRVAGHEFG